MNLSKKNSVVVAGIALGWVLLVISGVRVLQWVSDAWRRQCEELVQAQEQLRRMHGWLAMEGEVASRHDQVLGPLAHLAGSDLSWMNLQEFQRVAQEQGLSLAEIKPLEIPGPKGQPSRWQLDAKVEGRLEQISVLLQKLPEFMPGVRLENLQLMPQDDGRVQGLLRLSLFSPEEK